MFFFRNNSKNVSKNFKTALHQLKNLFNRSKRKSLRKVASCILKILDSSSGDIHLDHLHSFILDVIEKLYASKTRKGLFLNILYL